MELENKLKAYYVTAVLGVVFAVVGFTYNAWRMEVSEDNNNIRTASFEVLKELTELEQVIYAAHYDQDEKEGNPRKGWVKIGLIVDLSSLISQPVVEKAKHLKALWAETWDILPQDRGATNQLVKEIDVVREEIKLTLSQLQ